MECLLQQNQIIVTPYIEDIFAEAIDSRTIFKNITVLIDVKFNTRGYHGCGETTTIVDKTKWTYINKLLCGKVKVNFEDPKFTIKDYPEKGILNLEDGGIWRYDPNDRFVGEDSFSIIVEGGDDKRNIIRYNILVIKKKTVFKQLSVQENLMIPEVKPDAEDIENVVVRIEILKTYPIKTPKAISQEKQILTGWKLIVEGVLKQKIQYVADEQRQGVHSAHYSIPFSTFLVLPEHYNCGLPVHVNACVEDVYAKLINKRKVFKNITFLISAKIS